MSYRTQDYGYVQRLRFKKSIILSQSKTGIIVFDAVSRKKNTIKLDNDIALSLFNNGYNQVGCLDHDLIINNINLFNVFISKGWMEIDDDYELDVSSFDKERFKRQADYFSAYHEHADRWSSQKILFSKSVAIIGLGGSGSNVAFSLAAVGVGNLTIIDDDVVDLSNLNRSVFFNIKDIGINKAVSLKKNISKFNSNTNVTISNCRISTESDFNFLKNFDLIINCADKPSIRETTNLLIKGLGRDVPPILVGPGYFLDYGRMGPLIPDLSFPCVECGTIESRERDRFGSDAAASGGSFGPNVIILANLCCRDAVGFLTGDWSPPSLSAVITIDFKHDTKERIVLRKNVACSACGRV